MEYGYMYSCMWLNRANINVNLFVFWNIDDNACNRALLIS